jgi:hypothetical protein
MASRTEELRKRLIAANSPLVGHSMNQDVLKDALEQQKRGLPSKKVVRAMQRRLRKTQQEMEE